MTIKNGEARINQTFAKLEAAAILGQRCPFSESLPGGSHAVSQLARDGRILVEVFMHNFRRVTILTGPRAGMKTADPPLDHSGNVRKPYVIVDTAGMSRNGQRVDTGFKTRAKPSAPRDFSQSRSQRT